MAEALKYIPILKGKRGEFRALKNIGSLGSVNLLPLIYFPSDKDLDGNSLSNYLAKKADFVSKNWMNAFLYDFGIDLALKVGGRNFLYEFDRLLGTLSCTGVPVTGPNRPKEYEDAVMGICQARGLGACIRFEGDALSDIGTINSYLDKFSRESKVLPGEIDLVLDFGPISGISVSNIVTQALDLLNDLDDLVMWRTVCVAASGFNMNGMTTNTNKRIPRNELALFRQLHAQAGQFGRAITFGDYGVVDAQESEVIWTPGMGASGKVRYTCLSEWLVYKGENLFKDDPKAPKFKQFITIAQQLVGLSDFRGGNFSWGDKMIAKVANGSNGTGTLETWISFGTNHHITLVAEQLVSLA